MSTRRVVLFAAGILVLSLVPPVRPALAGENIVWNGPGASGNTGSLRDDPAQWPVVQSLFPDSPSGNSVTVGGDVPDSVYGGVDYFPSGNSAPAETTDNRVNINGGAIHNDVFGGFAQSDLGTATATGNTVAISGGNIDVAVNGGYAWSNSATATANNNNVSVSGGAIGWQVFSGYARSVFGTATANNNSVNISGGSVDSVYGGYAQSDGPATANNNSVSVSGGAIDWTVYGGYAESKSGTASANNNSVTINGGSVGSVVYGGYARSDSGTATATHNTVTLSGSPLFDADYGKILGGEGIGATSDCFAGNTLKVWNYTGSAVVGVQNFQYYHFVLPASLQGFRVADTVALGNGSGTDSTITGVNIMGGGSAPQAGDVLPLLNASTVTGAISNGAPISGKKGVSLLYAFQLDQTADALAARVFGNPRVNPQAKALSEGRAASLAFVRQGQDFMVDAGFKAADAAPTRTGAGWSAPAAFGAIGGGHFRHKTGSHVDINGVSLLAGLAWRNGGPRGALLLGAFFEAGYADYDTRNAFASGAVRGDGDSRSFGGGVLARHDWRSGFYVEASGRVGGVNNQFDSDLTDPLGNRARYDIDSPSFGAHAGAGFQWRLNEKAVLDLSAKYLWSRQNGDSAAVAGDPVRFDADDSHRGRAGARFSYAATSRVSPYAGVAFEYEFDGKARADAYGYNYGVPALKGGAAIGELGLTVRRSAFSADLGVQGHAGRRDGVTGILRAGWEF